MSYGIHLLNTRTGDKLKKNANVSFFTLERENPTFYTSQEIEEIIESDLTEAEE